MHFQLQQRLIEGDAIFIEYPVSRAHADEKVNLMRGFVAAGRVDIGERAVVGAIEGAAPSREDRRIGERLKVSGKAHDVAEDFRVMQRDVGRTEATLGVA